MRNRSALDTAVDFAVYVNLISRLLAGGKEDDWVQAVWVDEFKCSGI